MNTFVGVLALAIALPAVQQPLTTAASTPDEIPYSQIEVGMDSPVKESGVQVITNQDDWKKFLTKIDEVSLKRPIMDWTKFQIVVATLEGSTKDGIALQLVRLHKSKPGNTDIEFQLSKVQGTSQFSNIDLGTSHNTLGKAQFPYAILKTPIVDTKWNIKVLD